MAKYLAGIVATLLTLFALQPLFAQDMATIDGKVIGPDGIAVSGADVTAVFLCRQPKDHPLAGSTIAQVVSHCKSEDSGRFQMTIRRSNPATDIALELFAIADGSGICFQFLEDALDRYDVTLKLPKQQPITGRLVDANGLPMANAKLSLASLRSTAQGVDNAYPFIKVPDNFESWPMPVETDSNGDFTLLGLSLGCEFVLELDDPRSACERWKIATDADISRELEIKAHSARKVFGSVIDTLSDQPISDAVVKLVFNKNGAYVASDFVIADKLGQFDVRCYYADEIGIQVSSPDQKHITLQRSIPWLNDAHVQEMRIHLDPLGYNRIDGTTADGKQASHIDQETPNAEIVYLRPLKTLDAPLSGSLFVSGSIHSNELVTRGVFAIDLASGNWRTIAENASTFRVSPNGKWIAVNVTDGPLRIVSIATLADVDLPAEIASGNYAVGPWMPNSESLVLSKQVAEDVVYHGEEYWPLDSVKWLYEIASNKLAKLDLPRKHEVYDVAQDGKRLAAHWDTHCTNTGAQLFAINLDGSGLLPLARKRNQYYWYPRFSPDGKSILAKHLDARENEVVGEHPDIGLRIIGLDAPREFALELADGVSPEVACWSPDGQYIATVAYSDNSKDSQILIFDSKGTTSRQIVLPNIDRISLSDVQWSASHSN